MINYFFLFQISEKEVTLAQKNLHKNKKKIILIWAFYGLIV